MLGIHPSSAGWFLGICTTGGVNAEVVGAIVERTRQRRITGVSFVCVCFSVSLSSLYHYLCLSCRCHAVHNKAASKFFFCVEKKLQVGVWLIRYSQLVHHEASMHFWRRSFVLVCQEKAVYSSSSRERDRARLGRRESEHSYRRSSHESDRDYRESSGSRHGRRQHEEHVQQRTGSSDRDRSERWSDFSPRQSPSGSHICIISSPPPAILSLCMHGLCILSFLGMSGIHWPLLLDLLFSSCLWD